MNEPTLSFRHYLEVLRRRKWLVLPIVVLVPLVAVVVTMREPAVYKASADVLLSRQNLAANLTGLPDTTSLQDPQRFGQTQAELARAPVIAARVVKAAGLSDKTPNWFLNSSSVSPHPNADLLTFSASTETPTLAQQLATEYGKQFVTYRQELDTGYLLRTQHDAQTRLQQLQARGLGASTLARNLREQISEIGTLMALQAPGAVLVRPATEAEQTAPRSARNGLLALGLAVVLGVALAFFAEAIDTRVADPDEIAERLKHPLLARIPLPRRTRRPGLAMLVDPGGPQAEAFRMLRINLELANLDVRARTILVTSAVPREGKTTAAANLGLALAAHGRRVILCDLDSRNPQLAGLFGLENEPGVVDVMLGHVGLDEALISVPRPSALGLESLRELPSPQTAPSNGSEPGDVQGRLDVLPFGGLVSNPGEFVGSQAVANVLAELRERADLVLVDSAPLLQVADALTLSTRVDAMLVVARVSVARRPMLDELQRTLGRVGTPTLGIVAIGSRDSSSRDGEPASTIGASQPIEATAEVTSPSAVRLSSEGDD